MRSGMTVKLPMEGVFVVDLWRGWWRGGRGGEVTVEERGGRASFYKH